MSEHTIPENAIGRAGMLVALQKIKGLPDGRLALVRQPVGWVRELLDSEQPVFAWQVFLTGEPALVHGNQCQEIIVADKCLRPISQLAQRDLADMVEQHERDVMDNAVAQVRELVAPDEMESPEFERAMHLAFSEAVLSRAKEVVGVARVLIEVGFWKCHGDDGDAVEWRTVFEGVELHMAAAPGMFGDWRLSAYAVKKRSWHIPESVALNDWPRGKILQTLLELWERGFGNRHIPVQLELGWIYRQHQQDMRAIQPMLPFVYVDGDSWRRALRWLRESHQIEVDFLGPPVDVSVELEVKDGMLHFRTEDHSIGVKVKRGWVEALRLSLRCLLTLPPSSVRGPWIRIEWTDVCALVNGNRVTTLGPVCGIAGQSAQGQ